MLPDHRTTLVQRSLKLRIQKTSPNSEFTMKASPRNSLTKQKKPFKVAARQVREVQQTDVSSSLRILEDTQHQQCEISEKVKLKRKRNHKVLRSVRHSEAINKRVLKLLL
jgi:hypothetical protein